MEVVAAVLILALLAGVWYRHDIKVAAAQTRRALVAVAARFASRPSEVKRESAAPKATSESALPKKGQAQVNTANVQHPRPPREQPADGGTVVIVQPHDDLRQICLRYVGRYDARLVNKISEFNAELTDPDHINVGQRIVLPGLGTVGTSAPGPSAVPMPQAGISNIGLPGDQLRLEIRRPREYASAK